MAGRGLVEWRGYKEWESYSTESGLESDLVYEMLPRRDGWLWVGTEAGLYRGEAGPGGMAFRRVAGLDALPVHSLQRAPDGDVWIGTETRGAARISSRTGKAKWFGEAQGLGGKAAYVLRFDRERRLWAATEAGLFEATPPYRTFARVAGLPSGRMWAVLEGTDGTMWAGGREGLFELAGGQWRNITAGGGLSNKEVLSLGAGKNGVVWVGYRFGGGIDRVRPRAGGVAIEKGVQRPGTDGLVYFLDFDAAGRLWAGTEKGVDVWDGSGWSHYDMSDGLAWNDCNLNAFAAEPDGTVWIGTGAGLSRFKPLPRAASDIPILVVFTRLTMGSADLLRLRNPSFGVHAGAVGGAVCGVECIAAERGGIPLPAGGRHFNLDGDRGARIAIRQPGAGRLRAASGCAGERRHLEPSAGGVSVPHSAAVVSDVVVCMPLDPDSHFDCLGGGAGSPAECGNAPARTAIAGGREDGGPAAGQRGIEAAIVFGSADRTDKPAHV